MNVAITLLPGSAKTAGPSPGGSLSGASPEVGDVVKLQVFVDEKIGSPSDGWEIDAPPNAAWIPAGGVTVSVASVRALPAEGNTTKLEIEAMVHQPGPVIVGPLRLRDQVTKAEIDVPPTTVVGAEAAAGAKPPQEPPWILGPVAFGGWEWATIGIFVAVLLALLGVLGRWIWLRLQAHLNRNLTYTERALGDLANLQKYMRTKKPLPLEEWKKFSFELAGVLRTYSDANFSMDSADMTDREFLEDLRAREGAAQSVHLLAQILGTITEVRYGRKELDASVVPGLLLDSRKFVETTTREKSGEGAAK